MEVILAGKIMDYPGMEGLHLQEKLSVNTLHCKLQLSMEVILAGKVICEYIVTQAVHGLEGLYLFQS